MAKQPKIKDIPKIEKIEKEEKEQVKKESNKFEKQVSDTFQSVSQRIKEAINIELFLPEIYEWIIKKIKTGSTLIIGNNVGSFSEKIASITPSVIVRDSSTSYVSPKTEIKDKRVLNKIDMKPFMFEKIEEIGGTFLNIIIVFTLKKLKKSQQEKLLQYCKKHLSRDGQLIIVEEFYPKSPILYPFAVIKESTKFIYGKIRKRNISIPLNKFDKTAKKLDLKFFDVKYDLNGRIRTYVMTKRWGALI